MARRRSMSSPSAPVSGSDASWVMPDRRSQRRYARRRNRTTSTMIKISTTVPTPMTIDTPSIRGTWSTFDWTIRQARPGHAANGRTRDASPSPRKVGHLTGHRAHRYRRPSPVNAQGAHRRTARANIRAGLRAGRTGKHHPGCRVPRSGVGPPARVGRRLERSGRLPMRFFCGPVSRDRRL
jgi:hypothetical protein